MSKPGVKSESGCTIPCDYSSGRLLGCSVSENAIFGRDYQDSCTCRIVERRVVA